jgi:zona occludens toxin
MITLLEGSPGHGKTYALIREIADSVHRGEPVATNVPLRDDWSLVIARNFTLFGRWRRDTVNRKAVGYRRLLFISNDISDLLRVRLVGTKEGRGKLIIDESHREMNTRTLHSDSNRKAVVNALSGHRHYGWDVVLASQDEKNIDTQVRGLYEFKSVVRNFKRFPWFPIWFNLFLRVTRWNDRKGTKAGVKLYGLSKGLANLYDTHALEHTDWPEDAIILPHPSDTISERARAVAAKQPTRARSVLAYLTACEPELHHVPKGMRGK